MVSSEVELKEAKQSFEKMDKNGDGILSQDEITEGLQKLGYIEKKDVEEIITAMDMNKNGQIEYTEFLAAMMDHRKYEHDDEKIKMAFKHLDFDDSGFIERNEIVKLMGCNNEDVVD